MFQTFLDSTQKNVAGGASRKVERVRVVPKRAGNESLIDFAYP